MVLVQRSLERTLKFLLVFDVSMGDGIGFWSKLLNDILKFNNYAADHRVSIQKIKKLDRITGNKMEN